MNISSIPTPEETIAILRVELDCDKMSQPELNKKYSSIGVYELLRNGAWRKTVNERKYKYEIKPVSLLTVPHIKNIIKNCQNMIYSEDACKIILFFDDYLKNISTNEMRKLRLEAAMEKTKKAFEIKEKKKKPKTKKMNTVANTDKQIDNKQYTGKSISAACAASAASSPKIAKHVDSSTETNKFIIEDPIAPVKEFVIDDPVPKGQMLGMAKVVDFKMTPRGKWLYQREFKNGKKSWTSEAKVKHNKYYKEKRKKTAKSTDESVTLDNLKIAGPQPSSNTFSTTEKRSHLTSTTSKKPKSLFNKIKFAIKAGWGAFTS
jgi:hypothetical protein